MSDRRRAILYYILFIAMSVVLLTACSSAPMKPCSEDPDQIRCQPRERGGRFVDSDASLRLRWVVCRKSNKDLISKQIARCPKVTMLAGL